MRVSGARFSLFAAGALLALGAFACVGMMVGRERGDGGMRGRFPLSAGRAWPADQGNDGAAPRLWR